ncbi:hypothetical protein EDEG_03334 [Edhazardia aedis USNM 41457]|uniref:Uncharacterized protein n=1 Tax=Edhazardia aedis (strain USNM 41457) TaxID=1003232 RepID=J9D320_EDHAE|nr:hypothetical protein EDEG_03334 [Edhazardia aedis USNM 41457]|eukprot:EJW02216.1 hypothetical protein EDEG_03334 [Edhazardia aedis USNM 41457]
MFFEIFLLMGPILLILHICCAFIYRNKNFYYISVNFFFIIIFFLRKQSGNINFCIRKHKSVSELFVASKYKYYTIFGNRLTLAKFIFKKRIDKKILFKRLTIFMSLQKKRIHSPIH